MSQNLSSKFLATEAELSKNLLTQADLDQTPPSSQPRSAVPQNQGGSIVDGLNIQEKNHPVVESPKMVGKDESVREELFLEENTQNFQGKCQCTERIVDMQRVIFTTI